MSTRTQTLDIAFPIGELSDTTSIVEHDGRSRRCGMRLWYSDWFNARRGERGARRAHNAQDLFAPLGSSVVAPEDGRITGSSTSTGPTPIGGHWLRIRAAGGRDWYMAHLAQPPYVRRGQSVHRGQLIALVGRTGNAAHACPHLHLSLKVNRRPVNPYGALRAAEVDPIEAPKGAVEDVAE